MQMIRYAVPPELASSALGQPSWADRIPNIYESGLTELEIEPLVTFWQESKRTKTRISPFRAAMLRLLFFAMRKASAHQCATRALLTFRPTEYLVDQAVDRFRDYLLELPSASVPNARKEQVDRIRKLGRILWVNMGVLDVSWQEFLRAQCVVELDDLD